MDIKYNIGKGYIAIPPDFNRATYIRDCYKNLHVSLQLEDGGFFNRVPISPEVLNFIDFPENSTSLGTCVVYNVDESTNAPYIVSRFLKRNEIGDSKEGEFVFKKRDLDGNLIEIRGNVVDKTLNITLNTLNASIFNIQIINPNEDSELKIDVAGKVTIQAVSVAHIASNRLSFAVQGKDEQEDTLYQQQNGSHSLEGKSLVFNKGDDPVLLGKESIEFLANFITLVGDITVTTAIGIQPIINKLEIIELKKELNKLLSKEVFIKQ